MSNINLYSLISRPISTAFSFLICLLMIQCYDSERAIERMLITQTLEVDHPEQIVTITDSLVPPYLYHEIKGLEALPSEKAKEKFIGAVLPAILIAKYRIEKNRKRVDSLLTKIIWDKPDSLFYEDLAKKYHAASPLGLLSRMKTHPTSIVLAQAALESGWGSSRIFQEANNLFGIWSYHNDEPRIPSYYKRKGNQVYLRKYGDISESITDYFRTIGRSRAYASFRKKRMETEEVFELLPYLKHYSERKEEYVRQLKILIQQNNFTRYDSFQLDPHFFVEVENN